MRTLALMLLISTSALAESAEIRGPSAASGIPTSLWEGTATPPQESGFMGFPLDKVAHTAIAANLMLGFTAIGHKAGLSNNYAILVGIAGTGFLVVLKELLDILLFTKPEGMQTRLWDSAGDVLAGTFGMGCGVVVAGLMLTPPEVKHRISFRVRLDKRSLFISGSF